MIGPAIRTALAMQIGPNDPEGEALDDFLDGELFRAALDDLVGAVGGEPMFGLMLVAVPLFSFWIAGKRDIAAPAVILALIGGAAIPLLPGNYQTIATTVMIFAFVSALLGLARRYVLSPGATA